MHKDTSATSGFKPRISFFRRPGAEQDPLSSRESTGAAAVTPARPRTMTMGLRDTAPGSQTPRGEPSRTCGIVVPPMSLEAVDPPDELPLTDIPSGPDTASDDAPFSLTVLDAATGHVAMALPRRWSGAAWVVLIQGNGGPDQPPGKPPRMGIQRVWLQNGQLHVVGRRSRDILEQLTMALVLLRELGVGSAGEPGFLEVLNAIPALLVAPGERSPMVVAGPHGSATLLHADREWVCCVMNQLVAAHWPSLACRLFLHLTPHLQQSLLRRSPSTVASLVGSALQPAEQRALGAVFEAGLRNAMSTGAAARQLLPWIAQCPAWAAASLLKIWDDRDDPAAKRWWLHECPALAGLLSDLGDKARPARCVMSDGSRGEFQRPPEHVLEVLREQGIPWQGSAQWALAIGLIRRELGQLVSGEVSDQDLTESYGRIIETVNLLPENNRAAVLLQTVMQELAALLAHKGVLDRRLDWLFDKLSRDFTRGFAQAAGHAFQHFCTSPDPDVRRLYLQASVDGAFAAVEFEDPVHLRWMLAPMIQRAGKERVFHGQVLLHSNARARLRELFGADELALAAVAPEGLPRAHWRVRHAYRHELAELLRESQSPAPNEAKAQLAVMAGILCDAAHDTQSPLQPEEMSMLASCIADASYSQSLVHWLAGLLKSHPGDANYAPCVAAVILNAVAQLYEKGREDPKAARFADVLMELLCRDENVPIRFDVRFAAPAMLSCTDWNKDTLMRWQDRLGARTRAGQRASVWMAELLTALDPESAGEERRQLVMYVRELERQNKFNRLNVRERGTLAIWRGLYATTWPQPYELLSEEGLEADLKDCKNPVPSDPTGQGRAPGQRNDT